jgi:hypothetical protein
MVKTPRVVTVEDMNFTLLSLMPKAPLLLQGLDDLDWGNVPGWLAAVATIGVFIFGFRLLGRQTKAINRRDDPPKKTPPGQKLHY